VGERITDHRLVLWIAGGGWPVIDPSAVRPPTLQTASASREPKGRAALLGQAATYRASMVAAATLVGGRCWAECCANPVEVADGLRVGAEQAGLDIGQAVLGAERPDQGLGVA
jgi:hypothetical protein